MSQTIKLVYQDCALCGSRGEKQIAKADAAGITIQKISFATPEGQHLCKEAVLAGVQRLPFYTNGLVFRASIDDFIETAKPKRKTTRKKTTETENGAN